ncbi:MAG: dNTP triphosphohydrolase [Porphyromonas sp.]|nr:dNTP triphosphohydrolase [Porphyromonas sp.]
MQWASLLSDRRLGSERREARSLHPSRSEFERDYDRLVFSPPFRRLQNKTQVFPLPGNVFVHNRLTHSLEVSCVGRSLGNIVGTALQGRYPELKDIDMRTSLSSIVSAACLAHDMGNPPFGHSGERAICAYFREGNGHKWQQEVENEGGRWQDFLNFEGNANALRLLTHQFLGRRPGGFALTYSTVASIIKYPYSSELAGGRGKFGFFQTEEATMQDLANELGLIRLSREDTPLRYARYPLVYLVEAADDICYQIMDIEDAYKLAILGYSEAESILMAFVSEAELNHIQHTLKYIDDKNERIGYLRSRAINTLAEETAQIFIDSEDSILRGQFQGSLISQLSPRSIAAYRASSATAWDRIYRSKMVLDVELAGHQIFTSLLDKLLHALHYPDELYSKALLGRVSSQYDIRRDTIYGRIQCALDYISGMTDLYALDLYRRITGMNLPAI